MNVTDFFIIGIDGNTHIWDSGLWIYLIYVALRALLLKGGWSGGILCSDVMGVEGPNRVNNIMVPI